MRLKKRLLCKSLFAFIPLISFHNFLWSGNYDSENILSVKRSIPFKRPQQFVNMGKFTDQSSFPYLNHDIWFEMVDNKKSFFIRPGGPMYPSHEQNWTDWLDIQIEPVTLVSTNNFDVSYPSADDSLTEESLSHPKLKYLYTMNPIIIHEKVRPLPVGLKYQFRSSRLFGEDKAEMNALYQSVSKTPLETRALFFDENRNSTVWVRPMKNTDYGNKYPRSNEAMQTKRTEVCDILQNSAPSSVICTTDFVDRTEYFLNLRKYSFVASPTGHGLDSHTTWEALLAGCIPIVPHSALDPMFEDLPVWLVDSWEEVTDEEVQKKIRFFKKTKWNFEKVFVLGWAKEIRGATW